MIGIARPTVDFGVCRLHKASLRIRFAAFETGDTVFCDIGGVVACSVVAAFKSVVTGSVSACSDSLAGCSVANFGHLYAGTEKRLRSLIHSIAVFRTCSSAAVCRSPLAVESVSRAVDFLVTACSVISLTAVYTIVVVVCVAVVTDFIH